jgi:hypothetical protein
MGSSSWRRTRAFRGNGSRGVSAKKLVEGFTRPHPGAAPAALTDGKKPAFEMGLSNRARGFESAVGGRCPCREERGAPRAVAGDGFFEAVGGAGSGHTIVMPRAIFFSPSRDNGP